MCHTAGCFCSKMVLRGGYFLRCNMFECVLTVSRKSGGRAFYTMQIIATPVQMHSAKVQLHLSQAPEIDRPLSTGAAWGGESLDVDAVSPWPQSRPTSAAGARGTVTFAATPTLHKTPKGGVRTGLPPNATNTVLRGWRAALRSVSPDDEAQYSVMDLTGHGKCCSCHAIPHYTTPHHTDLLMGGASHSLRSKRPRVAPLDA